MPQPSYYDTLGVARTAKSEEIKAAYRKLALKWHPERCADRAEAEAKFSEIAEAYEVLVHPARRSIFDQYGAQGLMNGIPDGTGGVKGGTYHFGNNAFEIFAGFFGTSSPFADITGAMGEDPPPFYGELTGMMLPVVPVKPPAVRHATPEPECACCPTAMPPLPCRRRARCPCPLRTSTTEGRRSLSTHDACCRPAHSPTLRSALAAPQAAHFLARSFSGPSFCPG